MNTQDQQWFFFAISMDSGKIYLSIYLPTYLPTYLSTFYLSSYSFKNYSFIPPSFNVDVLKASYVDGNVLVAGMH
jgi:hypothetical protein